MDSIKYAEGFVALCLAAAPAASYAANRAPTSSFTVTASGLTIKTTNTSSDPDKDALTYKWSFGDGATAVSKNPSHIYDKAGTYTVTLKVSDGKTTAKSSKKVVANRAPKSAFAATASGLTIKTTNTSSDPDKDALTYKWTFGDGGTSTAKTPSHTYAKAGTYAVTLTVSDGKATAKSSKSVEINQSPKAAFSATTNGLTIKTSNSSSDADGDSLTYKWSFGDGATAVSKNPSHIYDKAGTYTVTLTVSDGKTTAKSSKSVTINQAPKAAFSVTADGLSIRTSNSSSDPDKDALTYKWTFGDGGTSTAKSPSHSYAKSGTYAVTLEASDGKTTSKSSKSVAIGRAPKAEFTAITSGAEVRLSNASSDQDGDSLSYVWDFGDGMQSTLKNPTHRYEKSGTYEITLKASDGAMSSVCSRTVTVNQAPVASFSATTDGLSLALTNTSHDTDGDELAYFWDFGDGIYSSEKNPTHVYASEGDYVISLTVSDGMAAAVCDKSVSIGDSAPEVDFTAESRGLSASFKSEVVNRSGGALAYRWYFGDGSVSSEENPAHAYAAAGTYFVILTVSNAATFVPAFKFVTVSKNEEKPLAGKSFRALSASGEADEYRCGITPENTVFCWGNNSGGMLGNPEYFKDQYGNLIEDGWSVPDLFSANPVPVVTADGEPLGNVKSVAAANSHACAVTHAGEVYCWGSNFHGQLGIGEINQQEPVIPYASRVVKGHQNKDDGTHEYLSGVSELALAHNSSCALTNVGEVYCWGDNTAKQLGDDYPDDDQTEPWKNAISKEGISLYEFVKAVPYPVKVRFPEEAAKATKIAGGYWTYCALADSKDENDRHNLYCWGDDINGLISGNFKQYEEDFNDKYYGIMTTQDGARYIKDNWEWKMYEPGGDFYPLYGQPVTRLESVPLSSQTRGFSLSAPGLPGTDASAEEWIEFASDSSNYAVSPSGTKAPTAELEQPERGYVYVQLLDDEYGTNGTRSDEYQNLKLGVSECSINTDQDYGNLGYFNRYSDNGELSPSFHDAYGVVWKLKIDGNEDLGCAWVGVYDGVYGNHAYTQKIYWSESGHVSYVYYNKYTRTDGPIVSLEYSSYTADSRISYYKNRYGNSWSGAFSMCGGSAKCAVSNVEDADGVRRVTLDARHEFEGLTNIAVTDFDGTLYLMEKDKSRVYSYQPGYHSLHEIADSSYLENEQIVNFYTTPDNQNIYILTDAGKLYSYGGNRYGQLGLGFHTTDYSYTVNYESNCRNDGIYCWTVTNMPYVSLPGTKDPIANITDVSVNKRSVCVNAKTAGEENPNKLYCFGSSVFGELGFDDNNGGFSYSDVSKLWTGYSAENDVLDQSCRKTAIPTEVKFFDEE